MIRLLILLFAFSCFAQNGNNGPVRAFPGALGVSYDATGGRGGSVYVVTNLNNSGDGSFRNAFDGGTNPMTIVFRVSGEITLTSPLVITDDNFTIAGQTAPEGGITISGSTPANGVQFNLVDNAIIRYVRFRNTYNYASFNVYDAVTVTGCTNVVFDHCSISWGTDEAISFTAAGATVCDDITLHRTIMSHSKVGIIAGDSNGNEASENNGEDFSILYNLFAHISHRFPNITGNNRYDVINNVIHDYRYRIMSVNGGVSPEVNWIGNYFRQGNNVSSLQSTYRLNRQDWSASGTAPEYYGYDNILEPEFTTGGGITNYGYWHWWGSNPGDEAYLSLVNNSGNYNSFFITSRHAILGINFAPDSAIDAFGDVKNDVGANAVIDGSGNKVVSVDYLDQTILTRVNLNQGISYNYDTDWSGTSDYTNYRATLSPSPINTHPGGYDTDNDGMPDVWETAAYGGLTRDGTLDFDSDGYTDLEEYLMLLDIIQGIAPFGGNDPTSNGTKNETSAMLISH